MTFLVIAYKIASFSLYKVDREDFSLTALALVEGSERREVQDSRHLDSDEWTLLGNDATIAGS